MTGIFSSLVVIYLALQAKPKLYVEPVLAYNVEEDELSIRIMNRGRRQITDISAQVMLDFITYKGKHSSRKTIYTPTLSHDSLTALASVNEIGSKHWGLPVVSHFKIYNACEAIQYLSGENSDNKRILLTLTATDALSGTKVVIRSNFSLHDIKTGFFTDLPLVSISSFTETPRINNL